jgi:pimeloyl-ACP methyl ester carboxylesterase
VAGKIVSLLIALVSQHPTDGRSAPVPAPNPSNTFRVTSDSVPRAQIAGVILPARGQPKGTVFLCHGYSRRKEDLYGFEWLRREGWNLVLFDFREHGQSSKSIHLCSLGYHEIWDVKAVVDHAESIGLAKPYAVYGASMGASIGLRWAAHDPRIRGVLAVSPYRNGLVGAQEYFQRRHRIRIWNDEDRRGYLGMIGRVDLPSDLARRDDLRVWIISGQRDYFTPDDQRAILAGSRSPTSLKRLFIVPGGNHNNLWRWKGNKDCPGHDQIVRDFLRAL